MSDKQAPARRLALQALGQVIRDGKSLGQARELVYERLDEPRDRAFAMRLVQGVLRWRWMLQAVMAQCLDKPIRKKEHDVRNLVLMALYELIEMDTPDYAAVDQAVKLTRQLRRPWAKGLVNAVLRKFIRQRDEILESLDAEHKQSHPEWLVDEIGKSWPQQCSTILDNNNEIAATHLRVNVTRSSVDELVKAFDEAGLAAQRHKHAPDAVVIESTSITALPGFEQGWFSVQDAGAQMVVPLLGAVDGDRVLDLCAAPGGKACHLLELSRGDLDMLAVDIDGERLARVQQNLDRLHLQAQLLEADASQAGWYKGEPFDRILLDAPCSATGIIRRHPDIKSLRRAEDIDELVALQRKILEQAWPLLKPGGTLLYVTCSVLSQENSDQVAAFLESHGDASELSLDVGWGIECQHGRQLLPGFDDSDGFYLACLQKSD